MAQQSNNDPSEDYRQQQVSSTYTFHEILLIFCAGEAQT
jgi:hypothetical protein